MIVSHRHKFIFIKTRRTAGSSIEAVLSRILGPDDIITGSARDGTPRKNCPENLTGHVPWHKIEQLIGPDAFWSYNRFAVDRHPLDKTASDWLWHNYVLGDFSGSFGEFSSRRPPSDWTRYTKESKPVCTLMRFDHLPDAFDSYAKEFLGLDVSIKDVRLKANDWRKQVLITPGTRDTIAKAFDYEIDYFKWDLDVRYDKEWKTDWHDPRQNKRGSS